MLTEQYSINIDDKIIFNGDQILSINGLNDISSTYDSYNNANDDSKVISGSYINEKIITLSVEIDKATSDIVYRYFKPGQKHKMYLLDKMINFVVQTSQLVYSNGYGCNPILNMSLMCYDPYYYSQTGQSHDIGETIPMFGFPWEANIQDGITFGYKIYNENYVFPNNGDDDVGFVMTIKIREDSDNITNFKIEHLNNNQFIQFNNTFMPNDEIKISTVLGDKYVTLNGENIYNNLTIGSKLFYISKGDNYLKFTANPDIYNLDIFFSYTPKYLYAEVIDI